MAYSGLYAEAIKPRINWDERKAWADWYTQVGPQVRAIWHTLSNAQKMAIASDAFDRALAIDEAAAERMRDA